MLVDTHLHMDKKDALEIITEAKQNNVGTLVVSGCDKEGILEALDLINIYDNVYATIGFHPSEVGKVTENDLVWLEEVIRSNKKILGIGEIGLDYYYGKESKEEQISLFIKQLEIANKLNLPVVVHTRDAFQDTYTTLSKYNLKGIIHCFSGSIETAELYIKLGYYLGIGGVLTFKNSNLPKVVEKISLDKIVLETDSPYLSPEPYRGQKNSPKNIPIIVEKISDIKKISPEDVEKITYDNVCRIFDLKK